MSSYENPMWYDHSQRAYQMQLPSDMVVSTDRGAYTIVVSHRFESTDDTFEFITSFEDFDLVMQDYIKTSGSQLKAAVRVLLLYYDEKQKLHGTLAVAVSITRMDDSSVISDFSGERVKTFNEWLARQN